MAYKDRAAKVSHDKATLADGQVQEAVLAQIAVNKAGAQGNWLQAT